MGTWMCHTKEGIWTKRGGSIAKLFMTWVNELMMIWTKDGEQLGCGCVIPWGSYVPKGESL